MFLTQMMGVRRTSATGVAVQMQSEGLIRIAAGPHPKPRLGGMTDNGRRPHAPNQAERSG
jgi:hypothetical protein